MAPPCKFFAQGMCRNGASCPFSHAGVFAAAGPSAPFDAADARIPCRFFAQGMCRFGAGCRFSHDAGAPAGASAFRPDIDAAQYAPHAGYPGNAYGGFPAQGFPPQGLPQPAELDADAEDSDSEPPTPAYVIKPGMTFEQIMALKSAPPAEFSVAGIFDVNLALDALSEPVALLRGYLDGLAARAPEKGDPMVVSPSHPKPSQAFSAVSRVFDRLRQSKSLSREGIKLDDAGFMVLVAIADLDGLVRKLGITYGGSLFPIKESGIVSLFAYAVENSDPEMREIVESYHAQLLSKNSNFAKPRVIPSLEADYDIRPLPSSSPSAAVASILSSLDSDPTSLNIASSATREDMSTLVSLVSARDAGKISSLTCTELDVPPSDLARLISLLPNLGRAEMGSVKSLTNDFVHFLAITCPKLTFVGLRGHADEHSALTESVLTSLSQAIEGCEVDVRDQFWLGREFVAGTAFDLWKGRGGGKLHVGEGGEYVEL